MARKSYYVELSNEYLGKYKRVTGRTPKEVEAKATEQLLRWAQEEERARDRATVADVKARAEQATEDALARIEEYRTILQATLAVDDRIQWEELEDREPYAEPPPTYEDVAEQLGVPEKRPLMERIRPSLTAKRGEAERAAREELQRLVREHKETVRRQEEDQAANNAEVQRLRRGYETAEPEAVESYLSLVLANSAYPEGFPREFNLQYLPEEKVTVVDLELPSPDAVPRVVQYKYVASRRAVDEVLMKDRDFQKYYDGIVYQTIIRTIPEVFEGDYAVTREAVVVTAGSRASIRPRARTSDPASPRARRVETGSWRWTSEGCLRGQDNRGARYVAPGRCSCSTTSSLTCSRLTSGSSMSRRCMCEFPRTYYTGAPHRRLLIPSGR